MDKPQVHIGAGSGKSTLMIETVYWDMIFNIPDPKQRRKEIIKILGSDKERLADELCKAYDREPKEQHFLDTLYIRETFEIANAAYKNAKKGE